MAENVGDVELTDEDVFPCAHPGEESPLDAAHVGQRWFISWSSKLTETRVLVSGLPVWALPLEFRAELRRFNRKFFCQ